MSAYVPADHAAQAADRGLVPFGEMPDGRLVGIEDVPRGLACGAVCPECRSILVARKGEIKLHHFAHHASLDCSGGFETAVHRMAKQIVSDRLCLNLPDVIARAGSDARRLYGTTLQRFDAVELEVWMDGIRPDAVGVRGDKQVAIEFFVSHRCDPEKLQVFANRRLAAVEIDLSAVGRNVNLDELQGLVTRRAPRQWLYNPKAADAAAEMARVRAELEAAEAARRERLRLEEEIRAKTLAEERERERVQALAELAEREARHRAEAAERQVRRQAEAAEREAKRLVEEAARADRERVENAAECDRIRLEIAQHALRMLGKEEADAWMKAKVRTRGGSVVAAPDELTDPRDEEFYWNQLRARILALDEAQEEARKLQGELSKKAAERFRDPDRAALWVKAAHPALNMVSPLVACAQPGGLNRCLTLLSKVKA